LFRREGTLLVLCGHTEREACVTQPTQQEEHGVIFEMTEQSAVSYKSKEHFEATVIAAALLMLKHCKLPANRDDHDLYHEHPERWPLTERSLRAPSGKRGKGFDGLTYSVREWLKYGHDIEVPPDIRFGLRVLCWWHRDVWNLTMKRTPQKTYGEYMTWHLAQEKRPNATGMSAEQEAMLRELYKSQEKAAA
jgi:hypothetical protein